MVYDCSINKRIKALRLSQKLTKEEMGELLEIDAQQYSKMEQDGIITANDILSLADIFKVDTEYLLKGEAYEEARLEKMRRLISQSIENENRKKYSFLYDVSNAELNSLKLVFCLNKKERIGVYEYAKRIMKKRLM